MNRCWWLVFQWACRTRTLIVLRAACSHQGSDDQLQRHRNAIGSVIESLVALSALFREALPMWIGGSRFIGVIEGGLSHGAAPTFTKDRDKRGWRRSWMP